MKNFKIVIAGGSGFIGSYLMNFFKKEYKIIILSRKYNYTINNIKYVYWDGIHLNSWVKELENSDLLINLTGKNIKCIFNKKNKKKLLDSRINSIKILNIAIQLIKNPPKLWIQASSLDLYEKNTNISTENSKKSDNFLSKLIQKCEYTLFETSLNHTKKIILRFGLGLYYSGGILKELVKITKKISSVGINDNNIYISWFHLFDLIRIIEFLFHNKLSHKVFNVCVPKSINYQDFIKILGIYFNRPYIIPIPKFVFILISKYIMRIEPELILNSRQVYPKNLLELGFNFKFNTLEEVLSNLYPKR